MDTVLALLIVASFICLVLGLIKPALFKGLFKEKTSRRSVALTFGLVLIASFIAFGFVSKKPMSEADKVDLAVKELEDDQKENKNTETAAPALTPQETIKNIIQKELKGKNNNDKPYLKDINLEMEGNEASVIISYNADENLTANLTLTSIKGRMGELYTKLYKSHSPIKSVSVCAYMSLTDKYGNATDDIVYTTVLPKEEANKVNWSADDAVLKYSILPKVWHNNFLHPALTADE
jgi:hypothetical protein